MSYNPNRNDNKGRKTRRLDPHAGTKHSDIMNRRGIGSSAPANVAKVDTLHGYRNEIFSNSEFSQYFECMYAGNSTGFGINKKRDKTARVMRGSVYLILGTIKEDNSIENTNTSLINEGGYILLPKGTGYSLATSGTSHVELLVTEATDYSKDFVSVEKSIVAKGDNVLLVSSNSTVPRRERDSSRAQDQAAKSREERKRGRPRKGGNAQPNANSSSSVGVNPMPMGAAALAETD